MKISFNKIRYASEHYEVPNLAPDGLDKLVEKIGAQLGAVEEVIPYGDKFDDTVVVKVVKCEKHPNADKLNVCTIDDGGTTPDVKRDEAGLIQVVCGAPNVHAGMLAAWLPPGAIVPSTRDKDPFVLEARELRGVVSNGMLASLKELGIGDSHEGILEVDVDAKPGTPFAKAYRLEGEAIIDIENKMFTHRPDCFGVMGLLREIAGIQGLPFKSPDWYVTGPTFPNIETDELSLTVKNELPELVPRFTAITMRDVEIKPSPVWLQIVLSEVGIRPINNIVDLTNFWMLETGQPLHAYDYDKVKALSGDETTIVVRKPHKGETIKLLNGKEIEPRAEAIMIATDKRLIGIGGVMGGSETEVDENTKNIILECANFDMYSIRRTSMEHGLFTDAVTRFTKGQSPLQCLAVLARIVEEIRKYAGGKVASKVIDSHQKLDQSHAINVGVDFINERLGLSLSQDKMIELLSNVGIHVHDIPENELCVNAPFWRTDIEIPEDIVEEVGRLYGYDHLKLELPKRDLTPAPKDLLLELKATIRSRLAKAGANEVLTYSFVHGNLLDKVGQDKDKAFEIANALSPDLQYYRMSLVPSLLEKVHPNIKAGHDELALFELGKAHVLGEMDYYDKAVPKEVNAVGLVYAAKKKSAGAPYYQAKYLLRNLLAGFESKYVQFEPLEGADLYDNPWLEAMAAPFEPQRSAVLRDYEGLVWGVVGEFKPAVRRALKLPEYSAGFELDPLLLKMGKSQYSPLYRFPPVKQDITLQVAADVPFQEFYYFVDKALTVSNGARDVPVSTSTEVIDIYQAADDPKHKNLTFRATAVSDERTLTDKEVAAMLDDVAAAAKAEFAAERI